jgi:hypothetical protein
MEPATTLSTIIVLSGSSEKIHSRSFTVIREFRLMNKLKIDAKTNTFFILGLLDFVVGVS